MRDIPQPDDLEPDSDAGFLPKKSDYSVLTPIPFS